MTEKVLKLMDIREILIHIRAQSSMRQIQRDAGFDRRTMKRYRKWAQEQGLLDGELPTLEEIRVLAEKTLKEKTPPQNQSTLEAYREVIEKWVKENVEVAAIRQRLLERGFTGNNASVWRFVRSIQPNKRRWITT